MLLKHAVCRDILEQNGGMRFSVSLSRDDVEGERAGCLALVRVHRADAMMNVAADLEGCRPPFTLDMCAAGSHLKSGVVVHRVYCLMLHA